MTARIKKRQRAEAHLYQATNGRWYYDRRAYADVLGPDEPKRGVALVPPGARLATTEKRVALLLFNAQVAELEQRRHDRQFGILRQPNVGGLASDLTLGAFVKRFLDLRNEDKAEVRRAEKNARETAWLRDVVFYRMIAFLGAERPLRLISPTDLKAWFKQLRTAPGLTAHDDRLTAGASRPKQSRKVVRAPQPLSKATARHHRVFARLLFAKAVELEVIDRNPVDKLARVRDGWGGSRAPRFLEGADAALLLEAARVLRLPRGAEAVQFLRELLAVFLLAGLRRAEALGLLVKDVDLDRLRLNVEPNEHRTLKNKYSQRRVPIFPQLEEIIRPYHERRLAEAGPDALLFPGEDGAMLKDWRKSWGHLLRACGMEPKAIHTHGLRHTFASHALQLVRGGYPITTFDVGRLLGHNGSALVESTYGHLLDDIQQRSEVIEFRVEHYVHRPEFHARLVQLYERAGVDVRLAPVASEVGSVLPKQSSVA